MAWTYSDWITLTDASAQLTRLNLHIQEVSDKLSSADVTADGKSASRSTQQQYLDGLLRRRDGLIAYGSGSNTSFARRG